MYSRQPGFSLTELMVALTLSLILLAAIVQVFVSSKQGFNLQQGNSRAQESGRFGAYMLARTAREAGYYRNPTLKRREVRAIFAAPNFAISGNDGGANAPDTLTIRFQGHEDGSILDCMGNAVTCLGNAECNGNPKTRALTVVNTFALSEVEQPEGVRSLRCQRSIPLANPPINEAPQPLIHGVSDFQVLYGIDVDSTSKQRLDVHQYVSANAVTDWNRVATVRITLVTNSVEKVGAGTKADQRLTQTYTETIDLRNL